MAELKERSIGKENNSFKVILLSNLIIPMYMFDISP